VVVWGTPETRNSLTSIRDLLIDTPSGEQVRLGDVADVRIVPVPTVITHEGVKRYVDITADVQGRSLSAVASDVKSHLLQIPLPLEYHAEVLNEYAQRQAAQTSLFTFVVAAVLGIFLILQSAYRSWRLALASSLTLPLALVGGLLAVFATGGTFSIGSLIGFLALFGIAVRNSIVLINRYQYLERFDGKTFGEGLVLQESRERTVPILTAAFATTLVLLPALFLGDIPGLEIVRPMAVVILGGLVTSTLFSLFVVPTLYLQFGANPEADIELLPFTGTDLPVAADD
jgi:Cu/Ag efflux pump CusA